MSATAERRLTLQNSKLKAELAVLRNANTATETKQLILDNTISALADAFSQSNITSFMPLFRNNVYACLTLNWNELLFAYKTHGPLQTAHDQPALDAYRGGLELSCKQLSPDNLLEVERFLEENDIYMRWVDSRVWARLLGGGACILNVDIDPERPFDPRMIRAGDKISFYDACRWELGSASMQAEYFEYYGVRLHRSRMALLSGKRADFILRQQLAGWGMAEMERMLEPFNLYMRTINVCYELLQESKVDVFRLKHLNQQLGNRAGVEKTRMRVQEANRLKSYVNALVLDSDDEYTMKQITFSGLAEIINQARITLAASLKMPMTKIFGLSASGFNSGEDDIENYNTLVESEVRIPDRKMVRWSLRCIAAAIFGKPFDIDFKWKPLRILSAKDEEDIRTQKNNRFVQMYQNGVMTAPEWAVEAHKAGIVSSKLVAEDSSEDFPPTPEQLNAPSGDDGTDSEEND